MILHLVVLDLKTVSHSLLKQFGPLENPLPGNIARRDEVIYVFCSHSAQSTSPLVCFLVSQEFSHEFFHDVSSQISTSGGVRKLDK